MQKKTLVLVHGFTGGKHEFNSLTERLEKDDYNLLFFEYKAKFGNVPIETNSKKLKVFVDEVITNRENHDISQDITLIGFSQGGIISAYFNEELNKTPYKCICISSPFKGTLWSYFGMFSKGIRDLSYNNTFLTNLTNKIKQHSEKYYCIWNKYDSAIVPGKNAYLEHVAGSANINVFGHRAILDQEETYHTVKQFIED